MDSFKSNLFSLSERVRTTSVDIGRRMSEGMNVVGGRITEQVGVVSEKFKEMFHTPSEVDKMVENATSDLLIGPDWEKSLNLCDLVNAGKANGVDVVAALLRRLKLKHPHVQMLTLTLMETLVKNCTSLFAVFASERVLDEMVRLVEDGATPFEIKNKSLSLIESWGELREELRYLPVFEETYKSLKARGVTFPPKDPHSLAPVFTPGTLVQPTAHELNVGAHGPTSATTASDAAPIPFLAAPDPAVLEALSVMGRVPGAPTFFDPIPLVDRAPDVDKQELLSVARNSAELFSTLLTSAPREEVLKDEIVASLASECNHSKRTLANLIERYSSSFPSSTPVPAPPSSDSSSPTLPPPSDTNSDTFLFEALNVFDELEKALEKYEQVRKGGGEREGGGDGETWVEEADASSKTLLVSRRVGLEEEEEEGGGSASSLTLSKARKAGEEEKAKGGGDSDEKALREMDEMLFGNNRQGMKNEEGTRVSVTSSSAAPTATSAPPAGNASSLSPGCKEEETEDMIVF